MAGNVTGLLYGNPGQLGAQAIGALSNMIWVGTSTFVSWKITALIVNGHRVSAEVEDMGLDTPEMGLPAYPGSEVTPEAVLKPAPRLAVGQ